MVLGSKELQKLKHFTFEFIVHLLISVPDAVLGAGNVEITWTPCF